MYLHAIDASWFDHALWRTRLLVDDEGVISKLRDSGVATVQIDTSRGLDLSARVDDCADTGSKADNAAAVVERVVTVAGSAVADADEPGQRDPRVPCAIQAPPRKPAPTSRPHDMARELEQAHRVIVQSKRAVTRMFSEARLGKVPDTREVAALVEDISASVGRNGTALISLARLRHASDYTYMHSVAVCGLMIALGRELGFEGQALRTVGTAGLLHDIGKMSTPHEILDKPARLTDEEFAVIRGHPQAGHALLSQLPGLEVEVLDVCLHHHEKFDGSGYPEGLSGNEISLVARMGAVCDVYDAVTSERVYNKGWDPSDTIRRMASWEGHFDQRVFHAFVRAVGIYPVGSLVRLGSGRLGVVLEQSGGSLLEPDVRVFFDTRSGSPIDPERVSLARGSRDSIVARENPDDWHFENLDDYWLKPWHDDPG